MTENATKAEMSNVIRIAPRKKPQEEEKILTKKWGSVTMDANYTVVPSALIRGQERLGINATELAVLIHLLDHWWEAGKMPFPSKRTIATRLQVGEKTVQRAVARLESGGLIKRNPRYNPKTKGRTSNEYDLTPLVEALTPIAKDMVVAAKDAQEAKRGAERPGWKKAKPKAKAVSQ